MGIIKPNEKSNKSSYMFKNFFIMWIILFVGIFYMTYYVSGFTRFGLIFSFVMTTGVMIFIYYRENKKYPRKFHGKTRK